MVLACWMPTVAAAQSPGALDGEHFFTPGFFTEGMDGTPEQGGQAQSCDANGTSTVRFRATGAATGPYPGDFTETGTATIGPQTVANDRITGTALAGPVLTFTAQFEITSGTTTVHGTKTLSANLLGAPFPSSGACASFEDSAKLGQFDPTFFATISGRTYAADVASSYEATIVTATGTVRDTGESQTSFDEAYLTGGTCVSLPSCNLQGGGGAAPFDEVFYSPAPEQPAPACSNGIDDDGDGATDFPGDPGCTSAADDDETDPPPPPPPPVQYKNASERCKAERQADEVGFVQRYRNHGDCVSRSSAAKH